MAKKFRDLRWAMSTEAQTCAREKAKTMKAELPLAELRQARYFSQEQLADELQGGAATRGGKNREKGRYIYLKPAPIYRGNGWAIGDPHPFP